MLFQLLMYQGRLLLTNRACCCADILLHPARNRCWLKIQKPVVNSVARLYSSVETEAELQTKSW